MIIKLEMKNIFNENGFHIGETVLKSTSNTYMHTHDFYELFIIEEGEVNHLVNGNRTVMRKGDLYFVRPEDEHCFRKGCCKKAQFINFAFSEDLFQKAEEMSALHFDIGKGMNRVQVHLPVRMEIVLQSKLAFLAREKSNLFSISQKDMAVSILLDCFLILNSRAENEVSVPKWLENACLEMEQDQNYLDGLEKFVELCGKSQEHVTRSMKKYYNITPTGYLNRIRLEQAKSLLETTDDSILGIMLECGFNNVSHFNQLFKKNYGITPSRYRALNHSVVDPG